MKLTPWIRRVSVTGMAAVAITAGAAVQATPAQAAATGECTISVQAVTLDNRGGISSKTVCNKAKSVVVRLEVYHVINGQWLNYSPTSSWQAPTSPWTGTKTWNHIPQMTGAAELVVFGRVCYKLGTLNKCRERSDSVKF